MLWFLPPEMGAIVSESELPNRCRAYAKMNPGRVIATRKFTVDYPDARYFRPLTTFTAIQTALK
jgi:hypothetical protein